MCNLKIKVYSGKADIKAMLHTHKEGIVTGFTTNPSLMKKADVIDYNKFAEEVVKK